jgi:peptidoglycan/xylan/chitin deacetylase (PgdA/CDA1 family)
VRSGLAEATVGVVGRAIWHLRLAPLVWRWSAGTPRVLLYHACEPVESDFTRGLGVNTPPDEFASQIEFLAKHYRLVGPDDLVAGAPPRAVAVTFDDGYASVADHAAPILERHGATGTVYLVTDVVDNDDLVWVNEMNWLLVNHPDTTIPIATRALGRSDDATAPELVGAAVGTYDRQVIDTMLTSMWESCPADRGDLLDDLDLYLEWTEVERMQDRGWTFGSHTATHPDLRKIDDADFDREIDRSVEAVRIRLGGCSTFAYPFGFVDEPAEARARNSSVSSVMVVDGHNRPLDPMRVARTEISATTPAAIFSQLEVVGPVRSWAQRKRNRAVRLVRRGR